MRYTQKHPQHTYTKRDIYYFSRVIPGDLKRRQIPMERDRAAIVADTLNSMNLIGVSMALMWSKSSVPVSANNWIRFSQISVGMTRNAGIANHIPACSKYFRVRPTKNPP